MRRTLLVAILAAFFVAVFGAVGMERGVSRVMVRRHLAKPSLSVPKDVTTWKLNEDFDASDSLPAGWTTVDGDGDGYPWFIYIYNTHSGPNCAGSIYNSSGNNDWLITPPVSVDAGDTLYFWFAAQDPSWCNEHLQVLISTATSDTADFEDVILDTVLADTSWHSFTYDLSAYAGQTIYIAFKNIAVDMFIIKVDDVQVGQLPAYDGAVLAVDTINPYIEPHGTFTPMVTVQNLGSSPLEAEVYCYIVHSSDTVHVDSMEVSGLGYAESEVLSFPPVTLDIPEAVYQVMFEISNPADSNVENNYSGIYVYTYSTQRTVFLQEFTATGCTWCPYPAVALHRLKNELGEDVVIASYHIWGDYYSDPFALDANDSLASFYNITGIPSTACNGDMYTVGGSTGDLDDEYNMYYSIYEYISSTKTPVTLDVEITSASESGFDVHANVQVLGELAEEDVDLRLHYVITETNIPYHWDPGDVPLDSLFDVVRANLPDLGGVSVVGTDFDDNQHFALDPAWDADNCYLIAFVQDGVTGEVFYAVEEKIIPTLVKDSHKPTKLALGCSPNPFNSASEIDVNLPYDGELSLAVYDVAGHPVRTLADGNYEAGTYSFRWDGTDELAHQVPSGVYFVKLSFDGRTISRKLVLVK